ILKEKLLAQANTLKKHDKLLSRVEYNSHTIEGLTSWYDCKTPWLNSPQTLMQLEGKAACYYFDSWCEMSIKWEQASRVPSYWKQYHNRHDLTAQKARNACHPINSMLNFAYSLLASRIELACIAKGLDIAAGFLHADSA